MPFWKRTGRSWFHCLPSALRAPVFGLSESSVVIERILLAALGPGNANPVLEAVGCISGVFFGGLFQRVSFVVSERTQDTGWRAEDERTVRNSGVLGDQSLGADEALISDHGSIEDDCAHA